jgi:DNA modification methylase
VALNEQDWTDGPVTVMLGDAWRRLDELAAESVQCVITSPPYWGLRDYGMAEQLGLEETPELYAQHLTAVLNVKVRRVLRQDGTLWLNLGDSYAHGGNGSRDAEKWPKQSRNNDGDRIRHAKTGGDLKPKDLAGIPWRVAFRLQEQGWYLRSEIIWHKTNPMPESVTDRPTKAHETLFLLTKSERYYYDAEAVREAGSGEAPWGRSPKTAANKDSRTAAGLGRAVMRAHVWDTRNLRTVWTFSTKPYPEAHFATYPEALVEPCIKAGSRVGDTILDPFVGSGTTLAVARRLGRKAIGIELQPNYLPLIRRRVSEAALPLMEAISEPA